MKPKQFLLFVYMSNALLLLLSDRITKYFALHCFSDRCVVNNYLSFEALINRGFSWGIFNSTNTILFSLVTLVIIGITVLVGWYSYMRWREHYFIFGEVFVIAGSLSNIIDRFVYFGVIDFIELSYKGFMWPVFNIADVCIVIGVFFMMLEWRSNERIPPM